MQQAEKAAAETKTQRLRHLGLELQCGIVQLQFGQRIAQRLEVVRFDRIQPGEHLRLHFLEARQSLAGRAVEQGNRVADLRGFQFLDTRNHKADLARRQAGPVHRLGRKYTHVFGQMLRAAGHEANLVLGAQTAIDHAHQHHHANIVVEPRVDNQRFQRRGFVAARLRHLLHDDFQNLGNADPGLGRRAHRLRGIQSDDVLNFNRHPVRIGGGQVDLVQYRDHFDAEIDCGVAVRHRLRFDALRRVDHQQRAFARRQRARHFVREVHMTWCIDQIQPIRLAILRLVA